MGEISDVSVKTVQDVVVLNEEDARLILSAEEIPSIKYMCEAEDTDEINQMTAKLADMESRLVKYIEDHSVKTFSAKNIGCKKCGSSLAKEYLKSDVCPLCGTDLRSQSTIDGENQMKAKIDELKKRILEARAANKLLHGEIKVLEK